MKKKITYTTFALTALILVSLFLPLIYRINYNTFYITFYNILNPVELKFLFINFSAIFKTKIQNEYVEINLMNLFFYITLLIGTIQYYKSNEKEFKLLRFCLGVIFIYQICHTTFFYLTISKNMIAFNLPFFLTFISKIAQIFLSYKALNYFNSLKNFIPKEKQNNEESKNSTINERISAKEILKNSITKKQKITPFQNSSKSNRFLNFTIDTIVVFSIINSILRFTNQSNAMRYIFETIQSSLGPGLGFAFLLATFRFLYYCIFEIALEGSSPGKSITESRVISKISDKITYETIVIRTLTRFIPFEALSFFGKTGWHDDISNTAVVNENKGTIQLKWIVFYFIFLSVILIAIKVYYENYYHY